MISALWYNGVMKRAELKDSENRIDELETLYLQVRNDFVENYDDYSPVERTKIMQQLRGFLDDIAKEAGGRVKRQEISNTFGAKDSSFMELIAGIRGNLPEPKPVIDVTPMVTMENVFDAATETIGNYTGTSEERS